MRRGFLVCASLLLASLPAAARMTVEDMRCEYLQDPIGIDAPAPRLSWTLASDTRGDMQTGWQILAASDPALLARDEADLWDTGRVHSDTSIQIPYTGKPLASGQRCWWKVRVWDGAGKPSTWSKPGRWEMGLLEGKDWHGTWIGRNDDRNPQPAPLLRTSFAVSGKVAKARLYIAALGYGEAILNGERIGDHRLDPGYTRYDRRILYVTHDVTGLLRKGSNALGVMLGNGWFNVHTLAAWDFNEAPWRASPRMLCELRIDYADGRSEVVASGASWKTAEGPVVFNSIYSGESYDARREIPGWDKPGFDDAAWAPAQVLAAPKGRLVAQAIQPIRATREIAPVAVSEPRPGVYVFDFGQTFAGIARLRIAGPAGAKLTLKYAEQLAADGTVDQKDIAVHVVKKEPSKRFQTDEYTLKGGGTETWEPRFLYDGFRYVEVTGAPVRLTKKNLMGLFLHTDVPAIGRFACSKDMLNRTWTNTIWSFLSNLHGIPTDCPHREKNGWTGDAHLAAEMGLFHFDAAAVYTKWIHDLGDEQKKEDDAAGKKGALPGIVPTGGWGYKWGNGPAWDSAFLLIPWHIYEYCGDTRILEQHYDGMKSYVDYLTSVAKQDIVTIGLGDWCPAETKTPQDITSTAYYAVDARIVARAAAVLGKADDAKTYAALADRIAMSFNRHFANPTNGYFNGSQASLGCALYQDLVPAERKAEIVGRLVADIEKRGGHLDFGILGAKYVPNALSDAGRADVAYRLATQMTKPGWGWWLDQGATTLWEEWNGGGSRCHIMFGDICAWMMKSLAGIKPSAAHPGFKRFEIAPQVVGDLTWVKADYDSVRGRISSDWKRDGDAFRLRATIPPNTTALVRVPAKAGSEVTEGGRPVGKVPALKMIQRDAGIAVLEVGAGTYDFRSTLP